MISIQFFLTNGRFSRVGRSLSEKVHTPVLLFFAVSPLKAGRQKPHVHVLLQKNPNNQSVALPPPCVTFFYLFLNLQTTNSTTPTTAPQRQQQTLSSRSTGIDDINDERPLCPISIIVITLFFIVIVNITIVCHFNRLEQVSNRFRRQWSLARQGQFRLGVPGTCDRDARARGNQDHGSEQGIQSESSQIFEFRNP